MASTSAQTNTTKPLQTISWSEKVKNDFQWFKDNAKYYISQSRFNGGRQLNNKTDLATLYNVYNNQFPTKWFSHFTNPLNASKEAHKKFPAKIRPLTILRTNIDLLLSEYPRRPFIYQVNNLSDDGYSIYTEKLQEQLRGNTTRRFELALQLELVQSVEDQQQIEQALEELELPEEVEQKFKTNYKDAIAIQGQKWLKRSVSEYGVRKKWGKMFKDWLIGGQAYSYKSVEFGKLVYERVSPMQLDYDKSPDEDYVENGQHVVAVRYRTLSDIVDRWYPQLTDKELKQLETKQISSPQTFAQHFTGSLTATELNKIPEYHIVWKGRKEIQVTTQVDEFGNLQEIPLDEDTPVSEDLAVKKMWVNEVYETWQLGTGDLALYVGMGATAYQRNEMNNFSKCKLPYNGRKYSDTHSDPISVLEMGLPIQIMVIIINWTLERTIAKSKGKIMLIDKEAIPKGDGWDDEKFFYYAEALGYGLLKRNQIGVDKSWNQYQVLDMSLFDSIKQLIELLHYYEEKWDALLGVNRQRKGQTYASDAVGVNERATFQSTVMTDMIFNLFEEFTETEMQGILDLSRFINAEGTSKVWNSNEYGTELLKIIPEQYCLAELGVMVESSSEVMAKKNKIEGQVTAMLQNNVKPSAILKIMNSDNLAEIEQKLAELEDIQARIDDATAKNEAEMAAAMDERKKDFAEFSSMLKTNEMHEEYDRKQEIQDSINIANTFTFKDGDSNLNGVPDATEIMKLQQDQMKFREEINQRTLDRGEAKAKRLQDLKLKEKDLVLKDKAIKAQAAKAKAQSKKKAKS